MNNPAIPAKQTLFEPVNDVYGSRLALVFGNEFAEGKCPAYASNQCSHCDIGVGEGIQFNAKLNKERLVFFQQHYANELSSVKHLVVYNSGSTLNMREMSRETLADILRYASSLDLCKVVSLDSRETYITEDSLDYVMNNLRPDQQARIILGIESQSDLVRIGKLNKQMTKHGIENTFATIGKYDRRGGIDINIVFQPPGLIGEAAIDEAVKTLKYSLDLGEKYAVPVDFNFHPYYLSEKSRAIYPKHPSANLEDATKAACRMKSEIEVRKSKSNIFIGLQDEEHDQERDAKEKELLLAASRFHQFNETQDANKLVN